MKNILEDLEPKAVFKYFEEISRIPRGSYNNKAISDYCVNFAKELGLLFYRDSSDNVLIIKEATKGYEHVPTVIIQGHMDMVCEKNANVNHDFTKEPLALFVEGDFVKAHGTTLGADDAVAIAYAFAILESNTIEHPRLEVLLTTDEEVGMDGANAFDVSLLKGRYMLNIDSNDEGIFLVSSSGGMTSLCTLPIETESITGNLYKLSVTGLMGGHSGIEIDKCRANAICLMARLLYDIGKEIQYYIVDFYGGLKDNAIPREAFANVIVNNEYISVLEDLVNKYNLIYKNEYKTSDSGISITFDKLDVCSKEVLTSNSYEKLLCLFMSLPNGIMQMSADIKGLVESSLNIGVLTFEGDKFVTMHSVRSSLGSYKQYLSDKLETIIKDLGGFYHTKGVFPEWEYKKDSKLRELIIEIYKKLYNKEPKIEAVHAGLECGIISSKIEGMDILSFGPDVFDIHTPDEKLSVASTKRVYEFVLEVLKELK